MEWNKLLSTVRTGQENLKKQAIQDRTHFQRDYDRLIFSSPFRRLQDKTQVFPLPGSVFVHNRLTHSLEVASVGRSLGNNIAKFLNDEKKIKNDLIQEIGSIVAAGCLAHDMGNPPFGHSGETAISHFFKEGEGKNIKSDYHLSEQEWNDLTDFEGNANALRILTHQFSGRRRGGFSRTYSSVAAIVKYPYASGQENLKKYGFFQSEESTFRNIAQHLGIKEKSPGIFARHPLVYLVEAADDICYQIMDVEDAHKLNILHTSEAKNLLMTFLNGPEDQAMREKIDLVSHEVTDINEQISFIRASVIGKLVKLSTDIFIANYEEIMNGNFQKGLIDHLTGQAKEAMKTCKKTAFDKIYRHTSVVEIELSGFHILGSLLKDFSLAVLKPNDTYSKMLLPFIPKQFIVPPDASVYEKLQSVLDYISGMTDIYALDMYQKINGIGLLGKNH